MYNGFLHKARKTLLFLPKTAYFMINSHDAYKNVDGNSKFNITMLNGWKLTFWKQRVVAEDGKMEFKSVLF